MLPRAFENAFTNPVRNNGIPQFDDFATSARQNLEARGPPGVESFLRRSVISSRGGEIEPGRKPPPAARNLRNVWAPKDTAGGWSIGASSQNEHLSERERAVLEALYGTFDRLGSYENVEPGLDGVREYVEAKGTSIDQYAKEWQEQAEMADKSPRATEEQAQSEPSSRSQESERTGETPAQNEY